MATAVIIPVRNRALLLGKAIASVQKQTCQVDEIIVVDDGSTDDTVEAATQLSRQDSRIRVVVLAKNIGASAARNAGIDATECDWISFLDSDDQWLLDKHQKQLSALADHPDAIASFTGLRYQRPNSFVDVRAPDQVTLRALQGLNLLGSTSTAMIRREALKSTGGFDPTLPSCQDWDLWLRLRSVGEFAIVPDPLVLFNQTERVRISHNRASVLSGHHQLFAKILKDIPDQRERRIIRAFHQTRLAQIYVFDFNEPRLGLIAALRSMSLHRTREGKQILKEALRASVPSLLKRTARKTVLSASESKATDSGHAKGER